MYSNLNEFHKSWTKQLYAEFDDICFRYRASLLRPLIRIEQLESRWGSWDSQTRTITLSSRLIQDYDWSVVVEVFKHEMAHQYVDEVLGVSDAHGPAFKSACRQLGVEAWAQRAEVHTEGSLFQVRDPQVKDEERGILRKIERLLALAESSNENEAAAAMNKVSELYEKYQVEQLRLESKEDFQSLVIDHKVKRLASFHGSIASILTSYFSVKVIFSTRYDKDSLCEFKVLEILGRRENVQLAEYVYWYLVNTLKLLWENYQRAQDVRGLAARNSYYLGVLSGFEKKMRESRKQRSHQRRGDAEKALLLVEEGRLNEYLSFRHPRLHSIKSYQRTGNQKIYQDGVDRGKDLSIHSGVKSGASMRYLD